MPIHSRIKMARYLAVNGQIRKYHSCPQQEKGNTKQRFIHLKVVESDPGAVLEFGALRGYNTILAAAAAVKTQAIIIKPCGAATGSPTN